MNMLNAILGAQNGAAVSQIGSQLGLAEGQTTAALGALVPALAAGFQRNAQSAGGLENLLGALAGGRHAQYLDNPATLGDPDTIADGNGILGHVFGSKDVSRQIANQAAAETGIGADVLKRMLPMAAALVMGTLARQSSAPESALVPGAGGSAAGLMNLLTSTLDQHRQGSMLQSVMSTLGGVLSK